MDAKLVSTYRWSGAACAYWTRPVRSFGKRKSRVSRRRWSPSFTALVTIIRVGLEAGPLSQWLYDGLQAAGLEMVLLETRHVEATLSAMGLTEDVTGMLASQVWGRSDEGVLQEHAAESNLNLQDRRLRLPIEPARELIGFPARLAPTRAASC
jgi:hypothetical protein